MSGLVGMVRLTGAPLMAGEIDRAMAVLAPGGDCGAAWCAPTGRAVFGCQARVLTPESAREVQPFVRDGMAIVADVRLDNRDELAARLSIESRSRAEITDVELLLAAYVRWGEACVERLLGDFAFAIWDGGRRRLFAARDHIGARPLYYWQGGGSLVFASEIGGVLACPGVPAELDEIEVARLLLSPGYYADAEYTFYRQVRKLPFGHGLSFDSHGLRRWRHWRPEEIEERQGSTLEDCAGQLRDLVAEAVRVRLRSLRPIGAHLSGGMDSSSVAVLAARDLRRAGAPPLRVFSHSPPPRAGDQPASEHRRIDRICRQEGFHVSYIDPGGDLETGLDDVDVTLRPVITMDREIFVQRQASAAGVGLMLSGWGGDEGASFNGRGVAPGYLRRREWRDLAAHLELHALWREPRRTRQIWRRLRNEVLGPLLAEAGWSRWQTDASRERSYVSPALLDRLRPHLRPPSPPLRESQGKRAYQLALLRNGHLTARMESWAAFGADHGLTYAYPLADRRVLEFSLTVPGRFMLQGGIRRFLYRTAMEPVLPAGMVWETMKVDTALADRARALRAANWRRWRAWLRSAPAALAAEWWQVERLSRTLAAGGEDIRPSVALVNAMHAVRILVAHEKALACRSE